jgi:CheY-like chemotaxis protein
MNTGEAQTSGARILLVDDEPELLSVNRRLLSGLGYSVSAADSGREALGKIEADPPDLVVLDMLMPGMDGEATLRRIRAVAPAQKVIILSGFAEPDKMRAVKKLGILAYVQKPFELHAFAAVIRAALEGRDSGVV